jgi:hypothetical protein
MEHEGTRVLMKQLGMVSTERRGRKMDINAHETVGEDMECKKTRHERDTNAYNNTMRDDEHRKTGHERETNA